MKIFQYWQYFDLILYRAETQRNPKPQSRHIGRFRKDRAKKIT